MNPAIEEHIKREVRRFAGYELDFEMSDSEVLGLIQLMREQATKWGKVRDLFRELVS